MTRIASWTTRVSAIDAAGAAVAALFSLILFLGILQPMGARYKQAGAHLQANIRERQHLATLQTAIRALQSEIERTRNQVAANPRRILSESALNTRLADVASLSSECALTVTDLKPSDAVVSTPLTAVPIHMTGHGDYRSCALFIHLLHARFFDIGVHSFKLIGTPDRSGATCSFQFELRWITHPDKSRSAFSHITTASLPQ